MSSDPQSDQTGDETSELAMNAYVLLGNALHYLLRGAPPQLASQLDAEPGALASLDLQVQPLIPSNIIEGLGALSTSERNLLWRSLGLCLAALGAESSRVLGLPQNVAQETVMGLEDQYRITL